jgi:D-3-phosphoglycerate dehydrogenase
MADGTKATVLIPSDQLLQTCLDPVAATLSASDYEIVRPRSQKPADWHDQLPRADVIVLTPRTHFTAAELAAASKLKGIVFPTIGVEALDVAAATQHGIIVGFGATPEAIDSMAEANAFLIAALLLDFKNKNRALHERGWRDGTVTARIVRDKTIGFVGFGRIARATLQRLAPWGIRAQFFDPYVNGETAGATKLETLAALLRTSDVVNLQVTLTAQTRGLIGEAELALMRPDAFLVNTSRGGAIDEAALARALSERRIAGAALDTFEVEPLPAASPLRNLDNVWLTPHNVGHTLELQQSFVPATIENITRISRGEPPLYVANPEALDRWRQRLAALAARQT